ncbi:MAG: hypothetical protein U9R07_11135 [Pseudomonadota bacterium]|nr:hypothetical protein [Pseudomonadota bacterium]
MSQLYFSSGPAEIGPLFHLSRPGFYANWYGSIRRFDATFAAPKLLSFVVNFPSGTKSAEAVFSAPGQQSLVLPVSASNRGNGDTMAELLFQPDNITLNAKLLARKDWTVAVLDRRGRTKAAVSYQFPYDLTELEAIYRRQTAEVGRKGADKERLCGEDEDIQSII